MDIRKAFEDISNLADGIAYGESEANALEILRICASALESHGEWLNGTDFEYEFAECSKCGRMQYVGWDSHAEAKEKIGEFHKDYAYCPGCGAKMVGGRYVD